MKRTLFRPLLLTVLMFHSALLFSQELPPSDIPESGSQDEKETAETEKSSEEDLIKKTLPLDISLSEYFDLLAWCRMLGLDETGSQESLRQRLYNFYSVSPPGKDDPDEDSNILTLKDSDILDYRTVEDRTNISFTGEVELSFSDNSGTVHRIYADILDFNQDEQIISAYGNVRYELFKEGDDTPEIFRGNSLTFDIDSWAGLFFRGMSERETSITDKTDNEAIKFYYYGDVIYRSAGDTVILDDGSITTCDEEEPHLIIKAKKIWVLAPGEWAILNGIFYVGRVPMFYIPGFLKNGDPLFFNPTVGFVSDRGYTFQTTTYILGTKEKKEEDSIIDFMQVAGDDAVEREIDGLFLRKSDGMNSLQQSLNEYEEDTKSTLKLMADYYSYMGFFAGLEGILNKLGPVTKMEIYLGLAKSREVFSSGSLYTPLYKDDDGEYRSNWENGFFLNYEIPLRFALDVNLSLTLGKFSLGLDLPVYSDPYFLEDFSNRKENIELDEFTDFSSEDEDSVRRSSSGSMISSQTWELNTSFKPSTGILAPYLNSASINQLNFSMTWAKKSIDADRMDSSIEYFLYPSGVNYLDFSISLSGKLEGKDESKESGEDDDKESSDGLISPWPENNDDEETEEAGEDEILIRDIFPGSAVSQISDIDWYSQNISWSLKPAGNFYGKFGESEWAHPEDIDYNMEYQVFKCTGKGNIVYSSSFMDKLISVSDTIDTSVKFNNYFNRGESLEDKEWQSLQEQADALNTMSVNNNLTLNILPFQHNDYLEKINLKYQMKTNLYLWDWSSDDNEYITETFGWDEDTFLTHSLAFDLKGILLDENQSVSLIIDLPPDDMSYKTTLNLVTGPLTSNLKLEIEEEENSDDAKEWRKKPIAVNENLIINDYFSVNEKFSYIWEDDTWGTSTTNATLKFRDGDIKLAGIINTDLEEGTAESAELDLSLWNMSATFKVKRQYPYEFSLDEGWQVEEGSSESFLPDYLAFSYNQEILNRRFWKNRIVLSGDLKTSWNMDLIQFTDSSLDFDLSLDFSINDFITLSLVSSSENNATFRYFHGMAERAGVDWINPVTDLFKSFNFINRQDRLESNFNLNSLKFSMTHDLHDWDLIMDLEGSPEIDDNGEYNVYKWVSTFSIYVNWKAWSDLEAKIDVDDNEIVF